MPQAEDISEVAYFEARMRCTDWPAFWLFCANRPRIYGNLLRASNPRSEAGATGLIRHPPNVYVSDRSEQWKRIVQSGPPPAQALRER
jgi:hypothetical protein